MTSTSTHRSPAVAGRFYSDDHARLRETVEAYIDTSGVQPAPDKVAGLLAPHAGYPYSGPAAGHAYARCKGKVPKRAILLGCSHHVPFAEAAIARAHWFDTPLGSFPVDRAFADQLEQTLDPGPDAAHGPEHSLEVQLPFLACSTGIVPIVPILFGAPASQWHVDFGDRLAGLLHESDLVIASTDLSHFLSQDEANAIDTRSLEAVLTKNIQEFIDGISEKRYSMCGAAAVAAAMACAQARGADAWRLLDYRTSAGATGDTSRVVGYGAISMERPA